MSNPHTFAKGADSPAAQDLCYLMMTGTGPQQSECAWRLSQLRTGRITEAEANIYFHEICEGSEHEHGR